MPPQNLDKVVLGHSLAYFLSLSFSYWSRQQINLLVNSVATFVFLGNSDGLMSGYELFFIVSLTFTSQLKLEPFLSHSKLFISLHYSTSVISAECWLNE